MKKLTQKHRQVCGKYDSYSRDELVKLLDENIESLDEECRGSVKFEIEEEYGYGDDPGPASLYIYWAQLETDAEERNRMQEEARQAEFNLARERAEFERLKNKFGETK
jgi:hypothetical protein